MGGESCKVLRLILRLMRKLAMSDKCFVKTISVISSAYLHIEDEAAAIETFKGQAASYGKEDDQSQEKEIGKT